MVAGMAALVMFALIATLGSVVVALLGLPPEATISVGIAALTVLVYGFVAWTNRRVT